MPNATTYFSDDEMKRIRTYCEAKGIITMYDFLRISAFELMKSELEMRKTRE